ncbi:MAG: hypothetical protein WAL22_16605 [Solirubrobacteraceae bacterium]
MRRLVIAILVVALALAGAATAAQATGGFGLRTPMAVTPVHGTPTTTFTVRFKTPFTTGSLRGLRSWEIASVANRNQTSAACASTADKRLRPAVAHHRVSVRLSPAAAPWCTGAYTGTITLYRAVICNPGPISQGMACPDIAFAPEQIGRFRFSVARTAS